MPLAPSARCCRLLMQFVFPFQPRDTRAARASQLPWTISISSTPLGKYSAQGNAGVFPICRLKRGQGLGLEQGAACLGEEEVWWQCQAHRAAGTEAPSAPQGCGRAVCSDLSAVCSPGELLLPWLPGISPNASSSLALFRKQL